ncbi:hypothetical protein N8I74_04395 [Chitiniphilus purpureus]|uniref:Uncharacterized protein n=1 Tax=Chitiniphilus purpureus TaxID=2981137 RepID=A0ABY6DT65_9NEIS|nr:hypothetical protein [Chitiniphilus sp. CD1]UXY16266.1 hypothetical protein N8I74_04395 [Chitiniphilus sp. CD1]
MIAPEPYLTAYLAVVHRAIIASRSLAHRNQRIFPRRREVAQIADLQDAIHVVVELLNDWARCDETALRADFLAAYDRKWAGSSACSLSLVKVLEEKLHEARG